MRVRHLVSLIILALVIMPGCRKDPAKDAAAQSSAPAAQPPSQPAVAAGVPAGGPGGAAAVKPVPASLPDTVATVNGVSIKREELEIAIRNIEGRAGAPVPLEQRDSVYREVLNRIIGYQLLLQEARSRKVAAPPWEVDQRLSEIKQQFPNEQAFNEMLRQRGVTLDRLRQETADTIAVNQMLEKEFESAIVAPDADVQRFYDENRPRFKEAEAVRASHILIRVEQNADAATRAKARGQIEGLQKQLSGGADFAELARTHSQDPGSAAGGGDLGYFGKGQMTPVFEQAAFATKPGKVSGIVETPFGFHLIRVAEHKAERAVAFDEAKEQIREYLKAQLREQKSQAFIEQLRTKAKVAVLI